MPALDTIGQYLEEARRLLQDEVVPYRYPDDDIVDALNIGLMEARRVRADLFLPLFDIPWVNPGGGTIDTATKITFDPMYRSSLVYYVVGRMQLRDDEPTVDQRAAGLIQKFTAQLLTVTG